MDAQNFIVSDGDTINYTDANNNKQGFWKIEEANTEGYYVNNQKDGIWKSFYKNGNIKSEITYSTGKKRGFAKVFYEDGQIAEEGTWMEDKWTGKYKSYYRNGKLSYVWNYNEKGNRCGYQKYFYENGNIKIEGEWANGKESGLVKEYYPNGFLKSKKVFCDGKCEKSQIKCFREKDSVHENDIVVKNNIPNDEIAIKKDSLHTFENKEIAPIKTDTIKTFTGTGKHILYNKNKDPEKEGDFVDGVLINGKHYFYDKNNILIKTAIYKFGKLVEVIQN